VTRDEIIEAISKMTVLDLAELVKALEVKFGVSAAAPVAVAAGPAVSAVGAEAVVVEEEKTEFDLILKGAGEQKIQVIKVVRELTSLGLREAKDVVEKAPSELLKGISKEQAQAAKEKLEAVGAAVEIK
jgi:large subunit ribosomal protein L7/L12